MVYDNLKIALVTEDELNLFSEIHFRNHMIPFIRVRDQKVIDEYIEKINESGYNFRPKCEPVLMLVVDYAANNFRC